MPSVADLLVTLAGDPLRVWPSLSRSLIRLDQLIIATGSRLVQKFGRSRDEREAGEEHPLLSDRRNIIVIVDEAHRSHYDALDGYARHLKDALPHATLIAFTGTPVSFEDRNTRDGFGDYIDVYDLTRAVEDGATVRVHFQPRLIRVGLAGDVTEDDLDSAADEATAGLDDAERNRVERSVMALNAVYGAPASFRTPGDQRETSGCPSEPREDHCAEASSVSEAHGRNPSRNRSVAGMKWLP